MTIRNNIMYQRQTHVVPNIRCCVPKLCGNAFSAFDCNDAVSHSFLRKEFKHQDKLELNEISSAALGSVDEELENFNLIH